VRPSKEPMIRIEPISESPTIVIDRTPKVHDQSEAIEHAWRGLCAQNPRYFNGAMLAFDSYDANTGVIRASVEEYKDHAVRDVVDLGIYLLASTAILVAPDGNGQQCFLMGKRSPATHRYGNLWELGPSGGIDVPLDGLDTLDLAGIVDELKREIVEEVGIEMGVCETTPMALVHDDGVGSVDLVIRLTLPVMPALVRSWEYIDTRWITLAELREWVSKRPEELIPTTAALALRLDA